ncbi:MAG: hypothetical protein IPK85_02660 [Gemmatimonadetes bacterium]|nr:hypothetical protein [Gemmatimonadota bacterium]
MPSSVLVLHHCDVRKCRRLQHLWIGDDADNMRDRDEKGRGATPPQGLRETASRTKLDTQARLVIIEAIENGAKKELLAVRFGVHPKTIASIWRYRANDGWRK